MGGADQMVGCRSDVGYYLGGGSMREREKKKIYIYIYIFFFFNISDEQYITTSSVVPFIANLLRRLMGD